MIYKTLSVKQPWAFLQCVGIKDIENRTWKLPEKYRGERVLIHASTHIRKSTKDLLNKEQFDVILGLSNWDKEKYFDGRQIEHAIIGSVRFIDCVINHPSIWAERNKTKWVGEKKTLYEEWCGEKLIYNWVAVDAILFPEPILNVKGELGFWDYTMTEEEYNNLVKIGL